MPSHGRKPSNPQTAPKRHGRKPVYPGTRNGNSTDDCCPMAAALKSAKDGQWRKARLYARLGVRSLAARIA